MNEETPPKKSLVDRLNLTVVICVTAIIAAASLAVLTITQKSTNNDTVASLKKNATVSCIASNVNRAAANASDYITYKGLQEAVRFTESQTKGQIAALKKLHLPEKVLDASIRENELQLANQKARLRVLFWTRLANCADPTLSAGQPQVFTFQKQAPDLSQLSVKNATQVTPDGSDSVP